ncbi:MAG: phosphatase, partial [Streptosporangiales bacterium]|nr:phosphatase [Streptosporangiales bacterium]
FAAERDRIRTDRERRAREMVARLRDLGVPVEWRRVAALAAGGAVGRPHVARAMVELGVVPDVAGAFTAEWIGHDGRAYVPKYALDPGRVIALVRDAGGVSVIAHPRASAHGMSQPDELLEELAAAGLTGVEVDHPDQPESKRRALRDLARALRLVTTGSSDYHGDNKFVRLAAETTSREAYEALAAQATGATPIRR